MNSFELKTRAEKVDKLVDALAAAGVSAAVAATLDEIDWKAVARVAKCNPPNSDTTKNAVVERLEQIERAAARKAAVIA